ncbi:MAG: hypothetical protein JXQ85_11470 [Cognatishimia sp.]|uniref:hypothetical protein n=1 Tax=Cognatishimia sp. TaxID=2211648 RepID=UPI003B8EA896
MLTQFISAITRAVLVAFLVALPALLVPNVSADSSQVMMLIALFGALLVFIEYYATYPSIIEFRNAPPFNRLRYVAVLLTVFVIASVASNASDPNSLNGLLKSVAALAGNMLDFPYSPVRLVVVTLPAETNIASVGFVRMAAGTAYLFSLISLLVFYFMVRVLDWPARNGAFNVWVNLPLFDPTVGGDVLPRLTRDGRLNIALGLMMPFLFPAFFKAISDIANPLQLTNPQTLIWTVAIWAFFPAGLVMRGIAMTRIASMIDENRKRAYAVAQGLQPV